MTVGELGQNIVFLQPYIFVKSWLRLCLIQRPVAELRHWGRVQ